MMNPNHSVWKDPDEAEEEVGIPQLVDDDSSDDELGEAEAGVKLGQQDDGVDDETDDEMIFEDWFCREENRCRGEREGVLGVQAGSWNPVAWTIDTGHVGTTVDPSIHKHCRWNDEGPLEVEAMAVDVEAVNLWMWEQAQCLPQWCGVTSSPRVRRARGGR